MTYRRRKFWGAIKPAVGTLVDASHSLAQGLDGTWPLNENGGGLIRDASGRNPIPGILTGTVVTWGASRGGPGLIFASGTSWLNLGPAGNYTSENFSVAMAFLQTNNAPTEYFVFKGAFNVRGWSVFMNSGTGSMTFRTNQAAANQITQTANSSIVVGQLTVLVVTRAGPSCRIYINGKEASYAAQATHINPVTSTDNLQLASQGAGTNPFIGGMYAYSQWKHRVLTPTDAKLITALWFAQYNPLTRRKRSAAAGRVFDFAPFF